MCVSLCRITEDKVLMYVRLKRKKRPLYRKSWEKWVEEHLSSLWHCSITSNSIDNKLQVFRPHAKKKCVPQKPVDCIIVLECKQKYVGAPIGLSALLGGKKHIIKYCVSLICFQKYYVRVKAVSTKQPQEITPSWRALWLPSQWARGTGQFRV